MIKITSFYLFQSLRRVTQEFHEDKAIVKMKSLTFEREFEFEYKDVGEISDAFYANSGQTNFGFWLLFFSAITLTVLRSFIYANLVLLRIEQILYISGLLLYFTSFKRSWQINISDKNDNVLTYMKQTRHNRNLIPQAIELMRTQSPDLQEITSAYPFPDEKFAFEHVEYNFADIKKTIDRFYENEIIGFQKGIGGESVYTIKYSQLSGKVYRGKSGNDFSGTILSFFVLLLSIIGGLFFGFDLNFGKEIVYLMYILLALFLLSFLLDLIKREIIGFYSKNGNIAYWTYINRRDKENIEKIIEFVQSKISPETKN